MDIGRNVLAMLELVSNVSFREQSKNFECFCFVLFFYIRVISRFYFSITHRGMNMDLSRPAVRLLT